jgi:DnaJ-class molecular chaperone
MTPDDDLMRRLARAGAIAPSPGAENGSANGANGHAARRNGVVTVRRPRKWESRCGKCGGAGTFKAAAGLCPRCGAIAVRQ